MTSESNNTQDNQPAQGNANGMSVAALVLGIVAILFAFIPGMYIVAFILGIIAIVLGAVGRSKAKKAGQKSGLAVAGLVLGIITVALALIIQVTCAATIGAVSTAVDEAAQEAITETSQAEEQSAPAEEAATSDASQEEPSASAKPAKPAPNSDYEVTIDGAELGQDYDGTPVVIVTYSWVNNSNETTAAYVSVSEKVFQDGVELPTAYLIDGVNLEASQVDVKPGASTTYQKAYKLSNTESPIEVEVTEWLDFDDKIIASETFEL